MSLPSQAFDPVAESAGKVFSSRLEMVFVLIVLAVWCLVDVWPRGRLDPNHPQEHRTDFTVYTAAGKAAISGQSPYSASNSRGWTYLYLPLFCLLVAPLSFLNEGMQCAVWFWVSVACLYGSLREFNRLNRWAFPIANEVHEHGALSGKANATGPPTRSSLESHWMKVVNRFADWGGILCVVGFSLPTFNCLQRGQVGLLQFYLTLLGTRFLVTTSNRTGAFVSGVVLASAIVLKMSPALPACALLFVLLYKSLGTPGIRFGSRFERPVSMFLGLLFGLCVGVWVLPATIVGWQPNQAYLGEWRRDVLSRSNGLSNDPFAGNSHSLRNQSPMNGFWLMGNKILPSEGTLAMDQPVGQFVLQCVRWICVLLTAVAVVAILSHGKENDLLIALAVANAATLLVVPIARGHYFMAMWPAVVWVPRWVMLSKARQFLIPSRLIASIPPILLTLHYVFEHQLGALGVLGVGSWLWFVLLTITLLAFVFGKKLPLRHST